MTEEYTTALRCIVEKHGGLDDLESEEWEQLNPLINEEVLRAAHDAGQGMLEELKSAIVADDNLQVKARDLKTMERIEVKKAMPKRGFKTNCDFMAFRVLTKNVEEIPELVDRLVSYFGDCGCPVHVRRMEYGPDIVQYMYVYDIDAGFLMELQIGHPFAAAKFREDSAIRDGKPGINFKDAKIHLYKIVKEKLLNGEPVDIVRLWGEAFEGQEPTEEWKSMF